MQKSLLVSVFTLLVTHLSIQALNLPTEDLKGTSGANCSKMLTFLPAFSLNGTFVSLSPQANRFGVGTQEHMHLFETGTGKQIGNKIAGGMCHISWSPKGTYFIMVTNEQAFLYDSNAHLIKSSVDGRNCFIYWSPTGEYFVATNGGYASLCDKLGNQLVNTRYQATVYVKWSPSGDHFTLGTQEGRSFDVQAITHLFSASGKNLATIIKGDGASVNWSPTGNHFTLDIDDQTYLYDLNGNQIKDAISGSGWYVQWSPEGDAFTTGATEWTTGLYRTDGTQIDTITGNPESVCWSPTRNRFTTHARWKTEVELDPKVPTCPVCGPPAGARSVITYETGTLMFNISGNVIGKPIRGDAESVRWSPKGDRFALTTEEDTDGCSIGLYDSNCTLITTIPSSQESVLWSPTGDFFIRVPNYNLPPSLRSTKTDYSFVHDLNGNQIGEPIAGGVFIDWLPMSNAFFLKHSDVISCYSQ